MQTVKGRDTALHLAIADRRIDVIAAIIERFKAWLPDGNSQIFRSYVFGPSGFWTMALLRYAARFDPFLSLDCARLEGVVRSPRKGRDQILPSGNLEGKRWRISSAQSGPQERGGPDAAEHGVGSRAARNRHGPA